MMQWNSIVIVLCSLLLIFLIWKEARRTNKSYVVARAIASMLAVGSLACLALPVSLTREKKRADPAPVILLTEGFNKDSVQAVLNEQKEASVLTVDKSIHAFNVVYIPAVDDLSAPVYKNRTLHVFGYGLNGNETIDLGNRPFIFHQSVVENSITSVGWTQALFSGEPLMVQGSFTNTGQAPVKLVLSGFNTALDSVIISAKGPSNFQLSGTPKHLGRAVYSISAIAGKDTAERGPLPLTVNTTQPLSVLLLAASPDFENKFLKDWLTLNGYKMAVRTATSKAKYDRQFANMSPVALDRITPSLLERFDVVIADGPELSVLPLPDIAAVRGAIENKGTGLIVKAEAGGNSSAFYASLFPLIESRDSLQHVVKLKLVDNSLSLSPLKIEQPVYIRNIPGTQSLVTDGQLHTLASSKLYGAGKVVLTTVPNSYSWQLAGSTDAYSAYWSCLLRKAAKKRPLQQAVNSTPALPQKDEEVHLQLQTMNEAIPQLQAGEAMLYPQQHQDLSYEWEARYWPSKKGWQSLQTGDTSIYWYVYSGNDWRGVKATEKINTTKTHERSHPFQRKEGQVATTNEIATVPKIYFLLLFVIATGFLWFEKKFNGN